MVISGIGSAGRAFTVLDESGLWMLVRRKAQPGKPAGVVYAISATSAKELWEYIVNTEFMGTCMTKKLLMKDGWRAERVVIAVKE